MNCVGLLLGDNCTTVDGAIPIDRWCGLLGTRRLMALFICLWFGSFTRNIENAVHEWRTAEEEKCSEKNTRTVNSNNLVLARNGISDSTKMRSVSLRMYSVSLKMYLTASRECKERYYKDGIITYGCTKWQQRYSERHYKHLPIDNKYSGPRQTVPSHIEDIPNGFTDRKNTTPSRVHPTALRMHWIYSTDQRIYFRERD